MPAGAIQAPPSWFFARRNFLQFTDEMPLGEVYRVKYPYTKGRGSKRYTGKHYCGTTAWTQGIRYADRPDLWFSTRPASPSAVKRIRRPWAARCVTALAFGGRCIFRWKAERCVSARRSVLASRMFSNCFGTVVPLNGRT